MPLRPEDSRETTIFNFFIKIIGEKDIRINELEELVEKMRPKKKTKRQT